MQRQGEEQNISTCCRCFRSSPMPPSPATRTTPCTMIGKAAFVFTVDVLGEINFPAQAVVQSQFRSYAPGVLAVIEHSMLPLGSIGTGADVAAQLGNVAQQERREIKAAVATVRGRWLIEGVDAGSVGVARHAQVLRVPNVRTELELVVAFHLRHVGDPLELLLAFDQGTIATRDAQVRRQSSTIRGRIASAGITMSNSPNPDVKLSPMLALGMPKFVIARTPASGLFVTGLYLNYPKRKSPRRLN